MSLYKSFDTADFLFEVLWRMFPNIVAQKDDAGKIIERLIISSGEFCDLMSKNVFKLKKITEGGFGEIGEIGLGNALIRAAIVSRGPTTVSLFYTKVITKIGKYPVESRITRLDSRTVGISDPLSDIVFGSMLGHLYDIGVCPFVTKYFGTYICNDKKTSMIIESADLELRQALSRNHLSFLSPLELKCILIQYFYCLYVMKTYFGAVHYDSHLRNIMLTDLSKQTDYGYHGKKLRDVKHIIFETGLRSETNNNPVLVVIPLTRFLVKLIDYGCMVAYFDRSYHSRFKRDMRVETSVQNMVQIGAEDALHRSRESKAFSNTVDVMFSLINIQQHMSLMLDNYTGFKSFRDHLAVIEEATESLIGERMTTFLETNKQFRVMTDRHGRLDWFMRNHSSGIDNPRYEDPGFFLTAMVAMGKYEYTTTNQEGSLVDLVSVTEIDPRSMKDWNTLYLKHSPEGYQQLFNRFETLLEYGNKCNAKTGSMYCKVSSLYDQQPAEKYQPNTVLLDSEDVKIINATIPTPSNPTYQDYNSWFNNIPVPLEKRHSRIEEVRTSIIVLKKYSDARLMLNDHLVTTRGISFPVGNHASFKGVREPLGFVAESDTLTVRNHLYPPVYNKYLGVLLYDGESMRLYRYDEFARRHDTEMVDVVVDVENGIEQTEQGISIATPLRLHEGNEYRWAVTVGPMLVWNGDQVFNESTMMKTHKQSIYKNPSNYIFKGTSRGYFGMSDSNEIQSHIVYMEKGIERGLLLIEGGGFLAPGLDRVALAGYCMHLGASKAACLYSGPTSNILFRLNDKDTYLSKSPVRQQHGAVVDIQW